LYNFLCVLVRIWKCLKVLTHTVSVITAQLLLRLILEVAKADCYFRLFSLAVRLHGITLLSLDRIVVLFCTGRFLLKSVEEMEVKMSDWIKFNRHNRHFTCRPVQIYDVGY
jgi:hypothetical protein